MAKRMFPWSMDQQRRKRLLRRPSRVRKRGLGILLGSSNGVEMVCLGHDMVFGCLSMQSYDAHVPWR